LNVSMTSVMIIAAPLLSGSFRRPTLCGRHGLLPPD
jgi:hypothetical protein